MRWACLASKDDVCKNYSESPRATAAFITKHLAIHPPLTLLSPHTHAPFILTLLYHSFGGTLLSANVTTLAKSNMVYY
jgi:hypothetical protein